MNTSLTDPFRPLLWLAVLAFSVGFAGFLAISLESQRTASQTMDFAVVSASDDA